MQTIGDLLKPVPDDEVSRLDSLIDPLALQNRELEDEKTHILLKNKDIRSMMHTYANVHAGELMQSVPLKIEESEKSFLLSPAREVVLNQGPHYRRLRSYLRQVEANKLLIEELDREIMKNNNKIQTYICDIAEQTLLIPMNHANPLMGMTLYLIDDKKVSKVATNHNYESLGLSEVYVFPDISLGKFQEFDMGKETFLAQPANSFRKDRLAVIVAANPSRYLSNRTMGLFTEYKTRHDFVATQRSRSGWKFDYEWNYIREELPSRWLWKEYAKSRR